MIIYYYTNSKASLYNTDTVHSFPSWPMCSDCYKIFFYVYDQAQSVLLYDWDMWQKFKNFRIIILQLQCNAVDPWIAWVWTLRIHIYMQISFTKCHSIACSYLNLLIEIWKSDKRTWIFSCVMGLHSQPLIVQMSALLDSSREHPINI